MMMTSINSLETSKDTNSQCDIRENKQGTRHYHWGSWSMRQGNDIAERNKMAVLISTAKFKVDLDQRNQNKTAT